jgi:hypothetical protein
MLYLELPYGITEAEREALPDTYGIPYFNRNSYVAIPDNYLGQQDRIDDSFLLEYLPEHITRYGNHTPLFRSISFFTDKQDDNAIEVLARDGSVLYYAGTSTLYFDIDTSDIMESQSQCRKLITYFNTIGIHTYRIFYSGSKGFHVTIELSDVYGKFVLLPVDQIKLLVDTYISKLSGVKLDLSIYNIRSIIRVNNTINLKTRLYKIEITHEELFGDLGDIEILALAPRDPIQHSISKISDYTFLTNLLALSSDLVQHNLTTRHNFASDVDGIIDPIDFVEEYIERGVLKPGTRHIVSLLLASYFRAKGLTQQEAENELTSFMARAIGSTTPVAQRVRESRNDIKTCYNRVIRFSKFKAREVLE